MAGPGKLLVANRGEIAVRIIRAARELGLATVQVHSNADAALLAVRLADEATEIVPPQASKSYLKVEAILKAARATGATAHDHHRRCKRLTSPASQGPDHHRSEPL